jgi:protein-disulfide isomerase
MRQVASTTAHSYSLTHILWLGSGYVRRLVVLMVLIAALLPASAGALPPTVEMLAERSLGSPQAPVTVVEYSSLTCPHCADFHRDVLPQIKSAYIDKDQVRWVFRDFPLDGRAMAAAMVARCVAPDRYFGFLDILFRDQQAWARSSDPLADIKVRAQLAGLSPADVDACLANKELLQGIQARAQDGQKRDGVDSTPAFRIDGTPIAASRSFADFKAAIDAALAKAK